MAKFQLEMGGKNPMVVLDDADLEVAVNAALEQRLLLDGTALHGIVPADRYRKDYDRFVQALAARVKALKVGDARKPGTEVGPVVDDSQLAQDLQYVEVGKSEGARLVVGGEAMERNEDGAPGYYLRPALFADTKP